MSQALSASSHSMSHGNVYYLPLKYAWNHNSLFHMKLCLEQQLIPVE